MADTAITTTDTQHEPTAEERRLAEIVAKREAIAKAREERAKAKEIERAIEAEGVALADDEALEKLEAEYGEAGKKIIMLRTKAGGVILKKPTHAQWRAHQDKQLKRGHANTDESEKIVRQCRLYPDASRFEAIIEEYPGALAACFGALATLVEGGAAEANAK